MFTPPRPPKKSDSILLEDILRIALRFNLEVHSLGNFQVEIVADDRLLYSGPVEGAYRYLLRFQEKEFP